MHQLGQCDLYDIESTALHYFVQNSHCFIEMPELTEFRQTTIQTWKKMEGHFF